MHLYASISNSRIGPRRAAFTLMEILVVMAILVIVGAIVSPAIMRTLETQRLRKSADLLRAEFAKTRLLAMKEGRIQMFRYQMGGNGFSAQAWYAADDGLEASASPAAPGVLPQVTAQDDFVAEAPRTLPEGVVFLVGEAVSDSRGMQIEAAAAEEGQYQQTWSPPILFYPDGTSSDAIIILANRRYQVVEVTLRGITGMSHSGDVTRIQEYDP